MSQNYVFSVKITLDEKPYRGKKTISGPSSLDEAIESFGKDGAFDYVLKAWKAEQVLKIRAAVKNKVEGVAAAEEPEGEVVDLDNI